MSKTVYLVLDMQNDLVHADGANGASPLGEQVRQRDIITRTAHALERARAASALVGFVRVGFSAHYQECPPNSPVFSGAPKAGLFQLGTWGTDIHSGLPVRDADLQIVKHRVSPFYSTTLEAQLRAQGVTRIVCSGVSTQAVVQATVRDAHDRDYEIVVLEDCCAAYSAQEHQNSIESIRRFCRVETSESIAFG
ncbi:Isochorismatase family protein YecD [Paraburkholderia hiiakae]|uniref:Isochorismatase family protein YecD n=1 Tax=Paraburkholderia hiiakae TaxID=1081782 RepID=A0ABN7HTD2_9BURK|nr:isochorismatase family cysteine hydrolase [Paraburkholderia hiiakae]CAD6533852.1 Isochorismatase family protein YecD [Paraburkholderia hiiakae]